jgi:DNA invertase Pin-like site-specific DNA recombinase
MQHQKPKRVALYARVSTLNQSVENQLQDLRVVAERNEWKVVAELSDAGISGAKGRDQRPAFDDLQLRAVRREFDVVMVWAIDQVEDYGERKEGRPVSQVMHRT